MLGCLGVAGSAGLGIDDGSRSHYLDPRAGRADGHLYIYVDHAIGVQHNPASIERAKTAGLHLQAICARQKIVDGIDAVRAARTVADHTRRFIGDDDLSAGDGGGTLVGHCAGDRAKRALAAPRCGKRQQH